MHLLFLDITIEIFYHVEKLDHGFMCMAILYISQSAHIYRNIVIIWSFQDSFVLCNFPPNCDTYNLNHSYQNTQQFIIIKSLWILVACFESWVNFLIFYYELDWCDSLIMSHNYSFKKRKENHHITHLK